MSRLKNLFKKDENKLIVFITAGFPKKESTEDLVLQAIEGGADMIEIGIPFSDPQADGPIIQKAHDRALQKNVSLSLIFNMIKDFRIEDNETPIVLMGYLNTFISHKDLIKNNEENTIDSILVVDIPGEFNLADYGLESSNVNTISLISPTTKENRIKSIAQNSSGFVYYVTLRGVTGSSNLNIDEISKNIEEIKKYASVPTLAGFGIKSPEDAKLLAKCSDGVIIGSSIVKMIEESSDSREFDRIGQYITEIKQAIS